MDNNTKWLVEVIRNGEIAALIKVEAKDKDEASKKAFTSFFNDIKVKIRKDY